MSHARFTEALGSVFEHSPWVAEATSVGCPFASLDELHARMKAEVELASKERQLELLRAHPDLGARARMSASSIGEQAGAGLDSLSETDYNRLLVMNAAYREKFGFPFIYAVKGSRLASVFEALERRVAAAPEAEFGEALAQVCRIARFRLEEMIS